MAYPRQDKRMIEIGSMVNILYEVKCDFAPPPLPLFNVELNKAFTDAIVKKGAKLTNIEPGEGDVVQWGSCETEIIFASSL